MDVIFVTIVMNIKYEWSSQVSITWIWKDFISSDKTTNVKYDSKYNVCFKITYLVKMMIDWLREDHSWKEDENKNEIGNESCHCAEVAFIGQW